MILEVGREPVTVEDLLSVARGERAAVLWSDRNYRARLDASCRAIERQLERGLPVYGVTTGVGVSVTNLVPEKHRPDVALYLSRALGVGTGRILDERQAAAVVAARLVSLASGHSGMRALVLERLCELLGARLLPRTATTRGTRRTRMPAAARSVPPPSGCWPSSSGWAASGSSR